MPKSAMIRARIEPELKEQAEDILNLLGLSTTQAISLFYHQIKLKKGMPFDISLPDQANHSGLSRQSQKALIDKAKLMSSHQRLEAFFNQSYFINQVQLSGKKQRYQTGA